MIFNNHRKIQLFSLGSTTKSQTLSSVKLHVDRGRLCVSKTVIVNRSCSPSNDSIKIVNTAYHYFFLAFTEKLWHTPLLKYTDKPEILRWLQTRQEVTQQAQETAAALLDENQLCNCYFHFELGPGKDY